MPGVSIPRLIGMIHLCPLPGSPRHDAPMDRIIDDALRDATVLNEAGFEALLIENAGDAPYFAESLDPAAVAALAIVADHIKRATDLPIGINALRNDARSALGIAVAAAASFIRVNVHVGVAATDQGVIEGRAAETLRYRRQLGADVAILADVHVKHAVPLSPHDIVLAAEDTAYRGLADALIVSGPSTGRRCDLDDVRKVKKAVPHRPVLIGSGASPETVRGLLTVADGVIVGTGIKQDGRSDGAVDIERARAFIAAARR